MAKKINLEARRKAALMSLEDKSEMPGLLIAAETMDPRENKLGPKGFEIGYQAYLRFMSGGNGAAIANQILMQNEAEALKKGDPYGGSTSGREMVQRGAQSVLHSLQMIKLRDIAKICGGMKTGKFGNTYMEKLAKDKKELYAKAIELYLNHVRARYVGNELNASVERSKSELESEIKKAA